MHSLPIFSRPLYQSKKTENVSTSKCTEGVCENAKEKKKNGKYLGVDGQNVMV